jgi:LysM domain
MAAVAVMLDHQGVWERQAPTRRPQLRLVPDAPVRVAPRTSAPSWALPMLLILAAVASVIFVLATGDGIPAAAESRGVAAANQSVVPPAGAVAAPRAGAAYVVRSGDSLWSIAAAMVVADDVPQFVSALSDANGGTSTLEVGQVLVLPTP